LADEKISNEDVAEILDEVADLLEAQQAQPYRALAYRRGAETLRGLTSSIVDVVESGGPAALVALPAIGENLAQRVIEIVETGGLRMLDRLRGEAEPEDLFQTIPGIGPRLAETVHDRLGIETLEELEMAAHDGRLAEVPGFGPSRLQLVTENLAARLGRRSRRRRLVRRPEPPVGELLDVDREYRDKAAAGKLPRLSPRRFNPDNAAWLPVLHTRRGERAYTALYSNTARAHALGKTRDWVVLFYHEDDTLEAQSTVVTEYRGRLRGRRVVRGREVECQGYYDAHE
jgi:hypothetical protein